MDKLEGCSEAEPDPVPELDIVSLTEQFGNKGQTLTCPGGNVIVGTCGGGWNPDCGGSF